MSTSVLIHIIAGLCAKFDEYRLSILCFYLAYGAILEEPKSATIEKVLILRSLAMTFMSKGNYEPAIRILTIAVNLEDPETDPEVKLFNQILICDMQLRNGSLGEPLRKLAEIRQAAEERGINRMVLLSDMITAIYQISSYQLESATKTIDRVRSSSGVLADATLRAELENFSTPLLDLLKGITPTASESAFERNKQMLNRIANYPRRQAAASGISSCIEALVEAAQSMQKAYSSLESNDRVAYVKAMENAEKLSGRLMEEARRSHDYMGEIIWGICTALNSSLCGKVEVANDQFKRCIHLARCHRQGYLARVYLYYTFSLMLQINLEEALSASVQAENSFVELYRNASSEDQKITINEERCLIGFLQMFICVLKSDVFKTVYACERYKMPTLRKGIQLPFVDADDTIHDFMSNVYSYCKENSTIIVYLSEFHSNCVYCWAIDCDRFGYHILLLDKETNSPCDSLAGMCNDVAMLSMKVFANLFRTFSTNTNSNSNCNLDPSQQFVNLTLKRLWTLLADRILI